MLTPEQLDEAGEAVAAAYRQIEAELIGYLVAKMVEGDVSSQRSLTAIHLFVQSMPADLQRIIEDHAGEIDAAAREEVERLLAASDAYDMRIVSAAMGLAPSPAALTVQTAAVLAAAREVAARDNLEMAAAARTKFVQWSTWAATQAATGNMTAERVLHRAVRELAREGLSIAGITYRDEDTGRVTITNKVDVAVQRHLRSLIAQGAAQLTMQRMAEAGIEFVEVSSHLGSRPSHCKWHGRCYHLGGAVEVDGVRYEDFEFGTGYRGVSGPYTALGDQLLGVNCRHSFAPWVPGMPHAYSPDPKSPTGLGNAEIYDLTQGQRARERRIREAKRELAAAQACYDNNPSAENAAEVEKAKVLLSRRQEAMRAYIRDANARCAPGTEILKRQPRREWAGDMPRTATAAELKSVHSGARKAATPAWDNPHVSAIEGPGGAEAHLMVRHGATATEAFKALPLDAQKEVLAGIDDAVALYGKADINMVAAMRSSTNDGSYSAATGTLRVSATASSPYLAGFHEAIHAIDAEKSSHMPGFDRKPPDEAYNMHSEKVLREARKAAGMSRASRKYDNMVMQVMGYSIKLFNSEATKPFEVVAYALDFEAQGKSNTLSRAIKERF